MASPISELIVSSSLTALAIVNYGGPYFSVLLTDSSETTSSGIFLKFGKRKLVESVLVFYASVVWLC